jgi:translation elongation factor EF-Ts
VKKKQLAFAGLMAGLVMSLSLCGCADETARPAKYTSPDSIEYKSLSANEYREAANSIAQTHNKRIGLQNKIITNQLERQDADIELMNERYLYGQNTTAEGFLKP